MRQDIQDLSKLVEAGEGRMRSMEQWKARMQGAAAVLISSTALTIATVIIALLKGV